MYYLNMSISDYDNNDIRDNTWLHSRLIKQKEDEIKAKEDAKNGKK